MERLRSFATLRMTPWGRGGGAEVLRDGLRLGAGQLRSFATHRMTTRKAPGRGFGTKEQGRSFLVITGP